MRWRVGRILVLLLLLTGGNAQAQRMPIPEKAAAVDAGRSRPTGGVQLDLEPRRAQVFVDGEYAGVVEDFSGYYHHLMLTAGVHRIEVLMSGYLPLIIEATVAPDRTITYRQSLQEASHTW